MAMLERKIKVEVEALDKTNISALEEFVTKYGEVLHSRHALLMCAKQSLSVAYGRINTDISEAEAKRKLNLCREVVQMMDILETGIATRKGNGIRNTF